MITEKLNDGERILMFEDIHTKRLTQRAAADKYGVSPRYVTEFYKAKKKAADRLAPYVHIMDREREKREV